MPRLLLILSLLCCVYCRLSDLDCALQRPAHCQTVLEAGDNDFAQGLPAPLELPMPASVSTEPVVLLEIPLSPPPDRDSVGLDPPVSVWSTGPSRQRPPPSLPIV